MRVALQELVALGDNAVVSIDALAELRSDARHACRQQQRKQQQAASCRRR